MTSNNIELYEVLNDKVYDLPNDFYQGKQIVLYGAGRLGELAGKLIKASGLTISYFVDKNYLNIKSVEGYNVYPITKLKELDENNSIILISAFKFPFHEISSVIREYSNCKIYTVYDLLLFLKGANFSNGWVSGKLDNIDKQNIEYVYNRLADSFSKETYLNILRWRISRNEKGLSENSLITEDIKYINEHTIPALTKAGIVLDLGAFDLSFSLKVLGKNKSINRILAFEPDDESYEDCLRTINHAPANREKIHLYKIAVSDACREQKFAHGHGLASRLIVDEDAISLSAKTVSIDEFISANNINEDITAIKLHIEGEELNALIGAEKIINKYKPLLMINCSHNRDGLWKIPHYIMQYKDYSFYMKSHAYYGEGLTFYAVPSN